MVINDERVHEHENSLGNLEGIGELARGLGLEVLDAVVGHISNCTASERWYFRQLHVFVNRELLLKSSNGIPSDLFIGTDLEDPEWVSMFSSIASTL